ncbi:MAG: hypothetical protein AB7E51_18890 [Pseudodesulfovibrio sp.]|uniref:hypothetical protein n=1 Tax=Pseudodesulfovibrio sp. TaxID=2035812 RepID=UPI003D137333
MHAPCRKSPIPCPPTASNRPCRGTSSAKLEETLAYVRSKGDKAFESGDDICTAIERMEALEFDVVLSFVSVSEIQFEFTRNYLRNQSVEHTNKIYRLQRCFD